MRLAGSMEQLQAFWIVHQSPLCECSTLIVIPQFIVFIQCAISHSRPSNHPGLTGNISQIYRFNYDIPRNQRKSLFLAASKQISSVVQCTCVTVILTLILECDCYSVSHATAFMVSSVRVPFYSRRLNRCCYVLLDTM